jgi:hypothetical protein
MYSNCIADLMNKKVVYNFFNYFNIIYKKVIQKLNLKKGLVDILNRDESLNDVYLQMIYSNIDLMLIFLFNFKNSIDFIFRDIKIFDVYKKLYLNCLYRQYSLFELLEYHYYDD